MSVRTPRGAVKVKVIRIILAVSTVGLFVACAPCPAPITTSSSSGSGSSSGGGSGSGYTTSTTGSGGDNPFISTPAPTQPTTPPATEAARPTRRFPGEGDGVNK